MSPPDLTMDAYACALPFGMWMALELQKGIDRFTEEVGIRFEPFWASDKSSLERQPWLKVLIAFVPISSISTRIEGLECPVINVSANLEHHAFPSVLNDGVALGRVAVEHLIDCGATRLFYFRNPGPNQGHRKQRQEGVLQAGRHRDLSIHCVELPANKPHDRDVRFQHGVNHCREWLKKQIPPIAVVAAGPTEAMYLSQAAENLGWTLGQEIALIQLTDPQEHLWYDTSHISCIPHDWQQVGYLAAKRLVTWVDKGQEPKDIEWVPPLPPKLTPSSDPSIGSDLATRVHSLLQHSSDYGLRVDDIAEEFRVSTSTLYRAVKTKTGRSLKVQLKERKLNEIQRQLLESDLAVEDIAATCGCRSVQTLTSEFKKEFGEPPGRWRERQKPSIKSPPSTF